MAKSEAAREAAAAALAAGKTTAEAAAAAGVTARAVFGWKTDPGFRARVLGLRHEMLGRACGELSDTLFAAARVLRELLTSANEKIRLQAATEVIGAALKVREMTDLADEVAALRAAVSSLEAKS